MKASSSKFRALAVPFTLLAAALAQTTFAQTTATTIPVGFITANLPAATVLNTSPSFAGISVPLYNTPDFVGSVATLDSASAFSLTGASLSIFDGANPRLVRVKSSVTPTHIGKFLLVTANTPTQLTITLPSGVLGDYVSVGDSVEVVPANTLAKLFGDKASNATSVFPLDPSNPPTGRLFFKTNSSVGLADNLLIWNGTTWSTFFNNNTNWKSTSSLANQNNTIIYPDDGIFVVRRDVTALPLTLMGTVPSTTEQTDLAGSGSTFIPNRFPVDTTFLATGLHLSPNWTPNTSVALADKVYLWESTTWGVYFYNGTNWKKTSSLANQNTTLIPAGAAIFITRLNANPSTLTQALPYTP